MALGVFEFAFEGVCVGMCVVYECIYLGVSLLYIFSGILKTFVSYFVNTKIRKKSVTQVEERGQFMELKTFKILAQIHLSDY